jgi:hypothetical protein
MTQQPDPIRELIRHWRQARANFNAAVGAATDATYEDVAAAAGDAIREAELAINPYATSDVWWGRWVSCSSYAPSSAPGAKGFVTAMKEAPANTEQLITEGAELQHLRIGGL